ncbi:epigen-like [Syngnathoides biaculeatus]|uniref:epigen-like n=1 Tax=Syngnathoides biaculeatus TaxID=300417 RepID=UPI002ADDDC1B|nr:epigen-like [Syngnathoides biaculeatus]
MFAQSLKQGVLSAFLLLLAASGHSAETTNMTRLENGSSSDPLLLSSHRPCGSRDQHFCLNGGTCVYPQDNTEPFCICAAGFSGNRCHYDGEVDSMFCQTPLIMEHLISIICGTAVVAFVLVFIGFCVVRKRCVKSAKQIESVPSEVTV